jgi:hypothetical protein
MRIIILVRFSRKQKVELYVRIYAFVIHFMNKGELNECGFVYFLIKIMMHYTGFNEDPGLSSLHEISIIQTES